MERSPCCDCVRKNEDKKACAGICERLHAYQRNGPWKLYPIPDAEAIEKQATPKDEDQETDQALTKLVKITEEKPKQKQKTTKKKKPMTNPTSGNANDHDKETKTSVDDTPEAAPAAEQEVAGAGYGVYIDFTLYPELWAAISARAQALMLPESHIILSLAAEALSNGG